MNIKADVVIDAKGLACPMPIVRTKKAMNDLEPGKVLEIQATDKGSKADLKAWSESTGHQYLGTLEEGETLKHYVRKSTEGGSQEYKYPDVIDNQKLQTELQEKTDFILVDVREEAEYLFNHIPEAISIPLGELDSRMSELESQKKIYVICQTGSRSDLAAKKLAENGFSYVRNVVPGMSKWTGATTGLENK